MPAKTILVVEDDPDTQRGLEIRLQASGYRVVQARDAVTAVPIARRTQPDLIILDLGLPGGEGFTVLDHLRALNTTAPIPILVLSARDPAVNKERALKAGAVAFLQKPADNQTLLAEIERCLGADRTQRVRKKILIIEDDADTQQAMSIRLRANEYDTVFASDGATAMTMVQREKPDLILLDLGLPGGDGFRVLERLRVHPAHNRIPVLVVSARDPALHEARARGFGARAFLQKPVDNDALLAAIGAALQ